MWYNIFSKGSSNMDHYPGVKVEERQCRAMAFSRERSTPTTSNPQDSPTSPHLTSFPPPSNHAEQEQLRNQHSRGDSAHEESEGEDGLHSLEDIYSRVICASPAYTEEQYHGRTEEERIIMRMKDYSKELSRIMGQQLVKGLREERGSGRGA